MQSSFEAFAYCQKFAELGFIRILAITTALLSSTQACMPKRHREV
jgi:hypothetical protein